MTQRNITLTLTDAGNAALVNAAQRSMDVQFTAVALGSGAVALDHTATGLTSQQEQETIFSASQIAPGQLRVNSLFNVDPATAYAVTELGLIGDGVLFGVWSTTDPSQALVVRTPGVPYTATITVGYGQLPSQNVSVLIQPLDVAAQAAAEDAVTTAINTLQAESDPFPEYVSGVVDQSTKTDVWRTQAQDNIGMPAVITAAIAAHDAAADPHPQYLTNARGDARYDSTGAAAAVQAQLTALTGVLLPFAASAVPAGYLLANGAAISRTSYATLFSKIGTTYGAGDGSTTFNLPDTRGVVLRGLDNGRGLDPGRTLGSYQADSYGSHSHGISDPGHAHSVYDPGHAHGVSDPGHSHTIPPGGWGQAGQDNGGGSFISPANQYGEYSGSRNSTDGSGTGIGIYGAGTGIGIYGSGTGVSVQGAGGSETRGKNLAVNFIIKY